MRERMWVAVAVAALVAGAGCRDATSTTTSASTSSTAGIQAPADPAALRSALRRTLDRRTAAFDLVFDERAKGEITGTTRDGEAVVEVDAHLEVTGSGAYDLGADALTLETSSVQTILGADLADALVRGGIEPDGESRPLTTKGVAGARVVGTTVVHHGARDDHGADLSTVVPRWFDDEEDTPSRAFAAAFAEILGGDDGVDAWTFLAGPAELMTVAERATGPVNVESADIDGAPVHRFQVSVPWSELLLAHEADASGREDALDLLDERIPGAAGRLAALSAEVQVWVGADGLVRRVAIEADTLEVATVLTPRREEGRRSTAASTMRRFDLRAIGEPVTVELPDVPSRSTGSTGRPGTSTTVPRSQQTST